MKRCALIVGFLTALTAPSAHAIGEVIIGNEPIGPQSGFSKELLSAVNMEERVYALFHDWHNSFYFKGGPVALNDEIRRFAAIPVAEREIILLAVPAKPLMHGKPLAYDWCLRMPGERRALGNRRVVVKESEIADTKATLTIYIPELMPPAVADPKKAREWIAELGSDDFKTRERAAKELSALGPPVAALLRDALKGRTSAEARDRIEKLLAEMSKEIRVDVLQIPDGIPVASLETLLARARKELGNKDPSIRGDAASYLVDHGAPAEEVLPDIEKVLKTETEVSPLVGGARAAWALGAAAKPLIPLLREAAKSDKTVKIYCDQAIGIIENSTAEKVSEADAKRRALIRKEIREFVEARNAKPAK